jgi:hypothetical protein
MSEIFTAPWYPWYADDILLSERVELMNLAEEGAYRRALDRAWKKGSIPSDPKQCAKAIGKGCSKKVAEVVLQMFTTMPGDPSRSIQERLEIVREEQRKRYLKLSAKGKDAAEKRWQGHTTGNATGIPQAMPNECHLDSDSEKDLHPSPEPERTKPTKPVSLPTSVESEINVWLDAMAPLTGAKDRRDLANSKRWREAVERAMKGGHELTDWLAEVKTEAQRNKSTPQYFTPESTLKALQLRQVKANNGFVH